MDPLKRLGEERPEEAGEVAVPTSVEWSLRILKLENRLQRERSARLQAEAIAEKGLRDLYERHAALLGLLEVVAKVVNDGRSVESALQYTVQAVCRRTGCLFGNVYRTSPDDPATLLPSSIFHAEEPARLAAFVAGSQETGFPSGCGLPGRVLASGQAQWISDVTAESGFRRAAAAKACGLHAGFAYPVLAGNRIVAVMEFFHGERLEPDEALLALLAHVGTQVGRLIERRQAEERLIHDATHDPLTGLPNRALFTKLLEDAVAMSAYGTRTAGFAVLFVDLDRFKLVNDSLGHAVGDAMLVEIARRRVGQGPR